jgi:DNA invertase Pin-like site-specific DNA recombinase
MASDYEARLELAGRMLNAGGSYSAAERATGIHHSTLAAQFPDKGHPPHVHGRRWESGQMEERFERFLRLHAEGWPAWKIAADLGVAVRTVQRWRGRAGLAKGPGTPFTVEEIEVARVLLEDGASYNEAARSIGRDATCLKRKLPGYGWSLEQSIEYAVMMRRLGAELRRVA